MTEYPAAASASPYPAGEAGGRTVMERLRQVHGVTWEWKDPDAGYARHGRQMGVIAQDVQAVFPDLVVPDTEGKLTVDYAGLIAPVIEAVKELDTRLAHIEAHLGLIPPTT